MQYIGDTRIQALISYAVAGDDRLARQAIEAFNNSRFSEGITRSRHPSSVRQIIPTFSLLWVGMVHDFWMYRPDPEFVKAGIPGAATFSIGLCGNSDPTAWSACCPGGLLWIGEPILALESHLLIRREGKVRTLDRLLECRGAVRRRAGPSAPGHPGRPRRPAGARAGAAPAGPDPARLRRCRPGSVPGCRT